MVLGKDPSLYGITNSNRKTKDLWGKNQFNSTFPVALACYMRDKGIKPIYLMLNENLQVEAAEITFDEVFNSTLENEELYFDFESKFDPYQAYSFDDIGGIDLVVKDNKGGFLRPLEIKLTVLPDSSTAKQSEDNWGSEIVLRPPTTKYCALGIADSCRGEFNKIRDIFEPICHDMQNWGNKYEILDKLPKILSGIDTFQENYLRFQKPLLLQPIWKTQGKSPWLADNAFDIFIWSDFALSRLFLDASTQNLANKKITRQMRSSARLARFLYHISTTGKAPLTSIYTEMAFGLQTDKEFAVNGSVTRNYMDSPRKKTPIIERSALSEIILNGGEKQLSPERRFDQTIYFTIANRK